MPENDNNCPTCGDHTPEPALQAGAPGVESYLHGEVLVRPYLPRGGGMNLAQVARAPLPQSDYRLRAELARAPRFAAPSTPGLLVRRPGRPLADSGGLPRDPAAPDGINAQAPSFKRGGIFAPPIGYDTFQRERFDRAELRASQLTAPWLELTADAPAVKTKEIKVPAGEDTNCTEWTIVFELRMDPNAIKVLDDKAWEEALEHFSKRQEELMKSGDSIENHLPDWKRFEREGEEAFYAKVIGSRRMEWPICKIVFTVSLVGVESEVAFLAGRPINVRGGKAPGAGRSILDSLRPTSATCKEKFRQRMNLIHRSGRNDTAFHDAVAELAKGMGDNTFIEWDPSKPDVIEIVRLTCEGNCPQVTQVCRARGKEGTIYGKPYALAWCGCFRDPSLEDLPAVPIAWQFTSEEGDSGFLDDASREAMTPDNPDCKVDRQRGMRQHFPPAPQAGPPVIRPAVFRRKTVVTAGETDWETTDQFVERIRREIATNRAVVCPSGYTPVLFLDKSDPLHIYVDCLKCEGACGTVNCSIQVQRGVNTYIEFCGC